ncbi:lytic transglycosylase domain-containing protein [Geotoga petraea]|uniref:Lytic transglycosylase domain-containing protein n=2 Tax=Geotoga petraea TaxID=28234 RepID=A0A4Z0W3T6_9BACT|nr:lytic transglycosylase domain-containing protein [Geotoga petraea]
MEGTMMKKTFIIIFLLLISLNIFAEINQYNRLFLKPGAYFDYTFNTDKNLHLELGMVDKYQVMESKDILKTVWSQERDLIGGQLQVESNYYTHAISSSNAIGLLQMKYMTAEDLYVYNLFDPYDNLKGALEYHGYLRRIFGEEKKQIAAYHDGPGTIKNNGMTDSGELYYLKVKKAQENYQNTGIYSPQVYGVSIDFIGNELKTDFYYNIAYRKMELYTSLNTNIIKNDGIIKSEMNLDYSFLYYPRTNFAYGLNNFNGVIRLGLPWEYFVIKFNNENQLYFQKKLGDYFIFKMDIKNNSAYFGAGFLISNIKSFVGYELFNKTISFELQIY